MRIGITGHQRIDDPTQWRWVESKIDQILATINAPLIGVTSLAVGADQVFARLVLGRGGTIEAVIPFEGYESKLAGAEVRHEYEQLLGAASTVETLCKNGSEEEAYFDAGKRVVDNSDMMIAVWNGKPAAGIGGTADVVSYAKAKGKRLVHINPYDLTTDQVPS